MNKFKYAELNGALEAEVERLRLLAKKGPGDWSNRITTLDEELSETRERDGLSIVLFGEYSAGKSTIAKALTGNREIKIGAAPTTASICRYEWQPGVNIVDVPGILTENQDHTDTAYEALRRSDLVLYCMTPQMLDSQSLPVFRKVAFEDGLGWKLIAVLTRMTDEGGAAGSRPEDRIKVYQRDLKKRLHPHNMDELRQCYIDAEEYLYGCEHGDEESKTDSRFQTLIDELNAMIGIGLLAKLPFNAVLSALDDMASSVQSIDPASEPYKFLLDQLARAAERTRRQLTTEGSAIVTRLGSEILSAAETVCDGLENATTKEDLRNSERKAQSQVADARGTASKELQDLFDRQSAELKERVASVCDGPLGSEFVLYLDRVGALKTGGSAITKDQNVFRKEARDKVKDLTEIFGRMGASTAEGLEQASKNSEGIRRIIYSVGKKAGKKFKPHGAATPAKKIAGSAGKAGKYLKWAKWLGPAIESYNLIEEIRDDVRHAKQERALEQERTKIRRAFEAHAREHEMRFTEIIEDAAEELFQNADLLIEQARSKEESRIAGKNSNQGELAEIRKSVTRLLGEARSYAAT